MQATDDLAPTLDILEQLIAFDTTSRNSNLELISWVEDFLAKHSAHCERIANDDGRKANLFATLGPNRPGGIILSGHSDVVPVDGQNWSSDPFALTRRGDKLYGRGTADMKGFIALVLAYAPQFAAGTRPVHLAISYDEEVGCQGAPSMIARMADYCAEPLAAIIGEPSLMQPIDGHKGITVVEVSIKGVAAHSSLTHLGISANMVAIELLTMLSQIAARLKDDAPHGNGFEPAHATLTVGTMSGGTAVNILAEDAGFSFDLRCPPDCDAETILAPFFARCEALNRDISSLYNTACVTFRTIAETPPLTSSGNEVAVALAQRLASTNSAPQRVAYAAEAGQFSQAGFPTAICGPGSIEQAHQADEWIAISQLEAGAAFMRNLAKELR